MSPREQPERVQAALRADEERQAREDRDPLPLTQARALKAALRATSSRYLLFALLVGGGSLTASETGAVDMILGRLKASAPKVEAPKVEDPRIAPLEAAVAANAKRTANTERLVRWLVRQEIRRSAREGGPVVEPPEDVE
jgi:hypothetical protein